MLTYNDLERYIEYLADSFENSLYKIIENLEGEKWVITPIEKKEQEDDNIYDIIDDDRDGMKSTE